MPKGIHPKTEFKKGNHPKTEFREGHIVSEETRKKQSEAHKGEKAYNWIGGTTKEYRKKLVKNWKKKNYDRVLYLNERRRVRKMKAEGNHTFGEWELLKKQYGYICPACGKKEPEIKLTEDHIIPLIKGGSDYIENIQPLCRSCNAKKHTKIIKY